MTSEREITETTDVDALRREVSTLFPTAFRAVVIVWSLGAGVALTATAVLPQATSQAIVVITIASGLIAAVTMLAAPLLSRVWHGRQRQTGPMSEFFVAALAGMILRVIGTVALFLTCRYHMAASVEMIVGMTIGWYLLLTSVEVVTLARELTNLRGTPLSGAVAAIETR